MVPFKTVRIEPGVYHVFVSGNLLYEVKKVPMEITRTWAAFWTVQDISADKTFSEFVSLKECKDFIKAELLKG